MSVRERQKYKVNVEQTREGAVELEAETLDRAMFLAERVVEENPEEVEWESEEIDTPYGTTNNRGE